MNASPACSVIVPSYRSAATIRACLTSLAAQDFPQPYEVIVVDSSPDETARIVAEEYPWVRLLHLDEQTGPERARNLGARQARGAVLAFIDSDCTAAPGWLSGLERLIQAGSHGAGGSVSNANGQTAVSWAGYCCEFRHFLPSGQPGPVDNLTLGCAAYQARAFWQAGGFPEGCFPQEDQVFHHIFRSCGFRLAYDPAVTVWHTHRTRAADFLRHQRSIGRSNARVVRRLGLPGAALARRPLLAVLALPFLAGLRWLRTLWACRRVERGVIWRRPGVPAWIALGMLVWGIGFAEGGRDAGASA
jgi:glycosyltransferase involved in cell wall biosynthesis